jgi:diguanylate cyclase (GGDEF)-like protein
MGADISRRVVARELAPFAAATLLAFALLPISTGLAWAQYLPALALMVAVLAGIVLGPWTALPSPVRLMLPVGFLLSIALLRHAGGGTNTGVAILALLPVFWVAMYGTRIVLGVMVLGVGAFFVLPILLIGEPSYPAGGLRTAVLFMLVSGLVGSTLQRLVAEVRGQAAHEQLQARELQQAAGEREMLMAQLERQAMTDALTGTGNRRAWDRWLELATAGGEAARRFSIGVLDLDHFKAFNDQRGHGAGDMLLVEAAEAWRTQLRPGDMLARIGGEEFAILLPGTDLAGATAVVRRLAAATPDGQTCSGGVAQWSGAETPDALLRRADAALYAAKRAGRDRVEEAGVGRFKPVQPAGTGQASPAR